MGDIDFEVPVGFDGTITIKYASTADPAANEVATSKSGSSQVEGILGRFVKHDLSHDHVAMAEYMRDLGFVGIGPKAKGSSGESEKQYIRWEYMGVRNITLYQGTKGALASDSKRLLALALTLEGGEPEGGVHPRVRFYYDNSSVEIVRAAAKSFKASADKA